MTTTVIVMLTTASCSGFAYRMQATDDQAARLDRAVEAYNTAEAWRSRNCDGTARLFRGDEALVAWHNEGRLSAEDPDGLVEDWASFKDWLDNDGEAYDADPDDVMDYMSSMDRMMENDMPARAA